MRSIVELRGITKKFGKFKAVDDVTLSVLSGSIFGFLGPNGAGKTTTISMMVGLTNPSSGKINILGKDISEAGVLVRKNIGFLSSDMPLDAGFSGEQLVEYFGRIRGGYDNKYVAELANRLECDLTKKFKNLSRGNKQKVALITALMHKPKLLILDEPTSGLDPLIQAEFNKLLFEHKNRGGTAFVSSHVLSEVQEICDEVAFIRNGQIVSQKKMSELNQSQLRSVRIISSDTGLKASLEALKERGTINKDNKTLQFEYSGDSNKLISTLAKHKIDSINIKEADLDTIFLQYYERDSDA